ncbi:hypothetical protein Tco_1217227 [Tanacetum coccineum]
MKWNTILFGKDKGCLDIGSLTSKNLDLLCKWKWRFLVEKDAFWRNVIREFYGEDGGFDSPASSLGAARVWRDIIKATNKVSDLVRHFKNSFVINVHNRQEIQFWKDPWHGGGVRLLDVFPRAFNVLPAMVNLIGNLELSPNRHNRWAWLASISWPTCRNVEEIVEHCIILRPLSTVVQTEKETDSSDTKISVDEKESNVNKNGDRRIKLKPVKTGKETDGNTQVVEMIKCSCCGESFKPRISSKMFVRTPSNIRASTFRHALSQRAPLTLIGWRHDDAKNVELPHIRYTELKFISNNAPDVPDEGYGSNNPDPKVAI